jgi:hypothetical protein
MVQILFQLVKLNSSLLCCCSKIKNIWHCHCATSFWLHVITWSVCTYHDVMGHSVIIQSHIVSNHKTSCTASCTSTGSDEYSSVESIFVIDNNTVVQCIQYILTLMTSVIWHILLINMRVFFNTWCCHENDHAQPKFGWFEYLSGWISYKLCQRHFPKDIYIRSWSSWSIIKLRSWSLWSCDYAMMFQAL